MKDTIQLIFKYFPNLSELQNQQFTILASCYENWNQKINVISRNDMDHFQERHVLHSLSIAKIVSFKNGDEVLDIGTGGGFPGIPLAILFPEVRFTLIDSIGKKIKVVDAVISEIGLSNVKSINARVESICQPFDFVVSRATAPLSDLVKWSSKLLRNKPQNGLIALKGGDLKEELKFVSKKVKVVDIASFFKESFFETKKIIFLRILDLS